MAQPYPISRETREEAIFLGDGGSSYGPFGLKIFDSADVLIYTKATGETVWTEQAVTITKASDEPFDAFSIAFAGNIPNTTKIKVISARVHERTAGLMQGVQLSPDALEKEITKIGTILQELARDRDRALKTDFDAGVGLTVSSSVVDGELLMKLGTMLVPGPSADTIEAVQGNAELAQAARDAAIVAKTQAEAAQAIVEALSVFTAGGTGQTTRSLLAKLRDIVSANDYGTLAQAKAAAGDTKPLITSDGGLWAPAIGGGAFIRADAREIRLCADLGIANDGSQDAANALVDAITYSQNRRVPVKADGKFLMSDRVPYSGTKDVVILGNGRAVSSFVWPDTVANPGLDFTFTDQICTVGLRSFRMYSSGKGTGTGIKIVMPALSSSLWRGPVIEDIEMMGLDVFNDCWNIALDMENCWNSYVHNFYDFGRTLTAGDEVVGTAGIRTKGCTDSSFGSIWLHGYGIGCQFGQSTGDDEGIRLFDFTILSCNKGIEYRTAVAEAGSQLRNGHINAYQVGIDLYAKHVGFVEHVDIYKISGSTADFRGIKMENCNGMQVDDILMANTGASGNFWGLELAGGNDYNKFTGFRKSPGAGTIDTMVAFSGTGNDDNVFKDIVNIGSPAVSFATAKSNHLRNDFQGMRPGGEEAFAANSATPSVSSSIWGYFSTANTTATTITNFTDSFVGQEFTVMANDANTTIQHNSGMILKGATNAVMPNGGMIKFRRFTGSVFREISRTF